MELINSFTVSQPVDRAWAVITDIERVAPCVPGAAMLGRDGDDYSGAVKIKVGPVTAQYEGVARFVERDDEGHHAVLRAEGRDTRGQGNAAATINLRLQTLGAGTEVLINTDLELAGRVAQFGRGVISDVSAKIITQFAGRLEDEMSRTSDLDHRGLNGATQEAAPTPPAGTSSPQLAPAEPSAQAPSPSPAPTRRSIDDVEAIDLMVTGGSVLLKQAIPLAAGVVGLLLGWVLGRRSGGTRAAVASIPASAGLVLNLVLPDTHRLQAATR